MPVLIGKTLTEQTSGGTITPSFSGLDIQANDWIGICLTNDHPSGTTPSIVAPSGYAKVDTAFTVSGKVEHGWLYKIAAGGDTAPTITVNNDDCVAEVQLWRGVDTSTPFTAVAARYDWTVTGSATSNTASVGAGDTVIYSVGSRQATRWRFPLESCQHISKAYSSASAVSYLTGCRAYESAGTFSAVTAHASAAFAAGEGGTMCAFALNAASTNHPQPDVRMDAQRLAYFGNFGAVHDSGSWSAANAFAGAGVTIGGIAVGGTASTISTAAESARSPWGTSTSITTADATAGALITGGTYTFGAAVDIDDFVASLEWRLNVASTSTRIGTAGVLLGFSDGTNWAVFQLATKAYGWDTVELHASLVKCGLNGATLFDSLNASSINWGAITKALIGWHRTTTGGDAMLVRNFEAISRVTLTGGSATYPAKPDQIVKAFDASPHLELARLQSKAQVQVRHATQIGDGTNATYYKQTPASLEFPQAFSASAIYNQQMFWNVAPSAVELRIKPKAGDTISRAASVTVSDTLQPLVYDAAGSTGATIDNVGASSVGFSPTLLAGETYTGDIFSGCGPLNTKGANLTNATVLATLATASEAAVVVDANGSTLQSCTIDLTGTAAGYHAKLGAAVTGITLNGTTLSGTPGTDKFYSELASGTLTITTDGLGTALVDTDVTFAGGSTATAEIAAPELYQSVAVTGLAPTYRLQIFDIEYVLTVSGVTVTPTAGATYTHNGITWTVRATSITAGAGTITLYGTGTPAASGALTKATGTGDASITFSAYAVDGTELYIGVPAATSYTWTDSVAAAAPRVIRVRVMEDGPGTSDAILMIDAIVGMCGITDGTESVGYLVAAVADDVYNDRGVDGSTVTGITIDDTTLRLTIASGTVTNYNGTDVLVIDGRDIYAYETYWLGTTAGMRDQARFIEAVDAVNFRCSNFKLVGASGYPILIRNCYMVDAVTGIFASLVDYSGDPISNAPDHMAAIVVSTSDAVISGTAAEIIAAIPTSANNATAVRSELANELAATTELWRRHGLDIAAPLTQTTTSITAGTIDLAITGDPDVSVTVTRQP